MRGRPRDRRGAVRATAAGLGVAGFIIEREKAQMFYREK